MPKKKISPKGKTLRATITLPYWAAADLAQLPSEGVGEKELEGFIHAETKDAILFAYGGKKKWIPKGNIIHQVRGKRWKGDKLVEDWVPR